MNVAPKLGMLLSAALAVAAMGLMQAGADYQPMELHRTIAKADVIVLGTISNVRKEEYVVADAEVVVDGEFDGPLEIKKVAEWPGNARWTPYRRGQGLLLMLSAPQIAKDNAAKPWRVVGFGGEGELPVQDRFVYVRGPVLKGFDLHEHTVAGAKLDAYRFDLRTFLSALEGLRRCFALLDPSDDEAFGRIQQICDDAQLAKYRGQSALHEYLAESTLEDLTENKR